MPTIDELPEEADPVHLLLVGDSKSGKSTYAAEAAKAGFTLIYQDSDNGVSAIRHALKDDPEAQKRVNILKTTRPVEFTKMFLRSSTKMPMKWNATKNRAWGPNAIGFEPDDKVWIIDSTKVPSNWIYVDDSWTSTAADALGIGDADAKAALLEGTDQGIYGEANSNLTYITNLLQKVPYHVIVVAHATKYEVYEKPTGVAAGSMKQSAMTLREIIDVPVSSSRPHGQVMGSRFNHIGWLSVDGAGRSIIDFERRPNRVGGGPPNRKAKTSELSFLELAHGVGVEDRDSTGWLIETTHGELKGTK